MTNQPKNEKIKQNKVIKISEEAKRALHGTKGYYDRNWSDTIIKLSKVFKHVKEEFRIGFVISKMEYNVKNYVYIDDSEDMEGIYHVNISLQEFVDLFGFGFMINHIQLIKQGIDIELREFLDDHIILGEGYELLEEESIDKLVLQQKEQINNVMREGGLFAYRKSLGQDFQNNNPYSLYSEIKLTYIITKKEESKL